MDSWFRLQFIQSRRKKTIKINNQTKSPHFPGRQTSRRSTQAEVTQAEADTCRTYDTEWLSGEAQASLPAPVAAAAASAPDPDNVLQTKHNDHHKLL